MKKIILMIIVSVAMTVSHGYTLERPEFEFKIFQFPRTMMPRIDGKTDDWEIVGEKYTYRTDLLNDTEDGHGTDIDTGDIDVKVRVGWVNGMNRLYFLYEAYDDFWDFERFEGGGYPENKFRYEDIPLGARLIAVADSYDAMTSDRAYRKAYSKEYAIEELKRCAGGQYDPRIVNAFM